MIAYSHLRVLIVDDFADFRNAVKGMLRQMGAKDIDTAATCEEGIAMCRRHHYDIILHDYNFGETKNGQQALEEMTLERLLTPHTIFIMVTAESSQAMVLGALEYEPDAYLTKPFNRSSLQQRLDKLVERKHIMKPVLDAIQAEDWDSVIECCQALIQKDPRFAPLCQRHEAIALRNLNRDETLEKQLKAILAQRPAAWAQLMLSQLQIKRGDAEAAEQLLFSALQQSPMLPALYDAMANAQLLLGHDAAAQKTLEKAVQISPRAIRRQIQLGDLARGNNDNNVAARAFREAVDMGRTSMFKSPDNYFKLAGALNAQIGGGGLNDRRHQDEVSRTLTEVERDYSDNKGVRMRASLLNAQTLRRTGKADQAALMAADAAKQLAAEQDQILEPDAAMDIYVQLHELGQIDQAEAIMTACVECYGDDPVIMKKVEKLSNNPALVQKANEARNINRLGIHLYEMGDIDKALEKFRAALMVQPRNISFALNTAQALLKLVEAEPGKRDGIGPEFRKCMDSLRNLPATDSRMPRYQQLWRRFNSM